MVHFLKSVGSNGLPYHTQFTYAPVSFSQLDMHYSYVAFRKTHFLPKLLSDQNVIFNSRSRRSSLSARILVSSPILSVPLGAGSSACALRGAPATGLVTPVILSQVTLYPQSIVQLCSSEFQAHNTIAHPYRAPSVQNSRGTLQYLPLSVISDLNSTGFMRV